MFTLILSSALYAHSGGTDANGCHAGSQPYHCHGGGGGYSSGSSIWVDPDKAPKVQAGGKAWSWPFTYKEETYGYCSEPREGQRCYPVYTGTRDQNIITCWMINTKTDQPVYCNFYLTDVPAKLAWFTPSSRDGGDVGSKVYKVRTLKVDLEYYARKEYEAKMAAQREHERLQKELEAAEIEAAKVIPTKGAIAEKESTEKESKVVLSKTELCKKASRIACESISDNVFMGSIYENGKRIYCKITVYDKFPKRYLLKRPDCKDAPVIALWHKGTYATTSYQTNIRIHSIIGMNKLP